MISPIYTGRLESELLGHPDCSVADYVQLLPFPSVGATTQLSDVAATLGYGAIFDQEWFTGAWSSAQASLSMA